MKVLSINIGRVRSIPGAARESGIYKEPVSGPVRVTALGLAGDQICNARHHGGADQAVYLYSAKDCAWWSEQLGCALGPGTFGENLTADDLAGLERVGDRLQIGDVVLEATSPRIPCANLAARIGDPKFVRRFREAERPGVYCRVLVEGTITPGAPAELFPYGGDPVSLRELFRTAFEGALDEAAIRRQLAAPIASRTRRALERKLAAHETG